MDREKTLKEKLSEMPAEAGFRQNHLARFLALQNEIEDVLGTGWTAKAVWHLLYKEKKFTGKYDCFLKYVRRYIKSNDNKSIKPLPSNQAATDAVSMSRENSDNENKKKHENEQIQNGKLWKRPQVDEEVFDYNPNITDEKRIKMFGSIK